MQAESDALAKANAGDNLGERGLKHMMNGTLETRREEEEIFKDIPRPEVLEKPGGSCRVGGREGKGGGMCRVRVVTEGRGKGGDEGGGGFFVRGVVGGVLLERGGHSISGFRMVWWRGGGVRGALFFGSNYGSSSCWLGVADIEERDVLCFVLPAAAASSVTTQFFEQLRSGVRRTRRR